MRDKDSRGFHRTQPLLIRTRHLHGVNPARTSFTAFRPQIGRKRPGDLPIRGGVAISQPVHWFVAANPRDLTDRRTGTARIRRGRTHRDRCHLVIRRPQ